MDTGYGAHLDVVPAVTLATNNLMSLFGLHRRLRGALLGHLAAFEMTSSLPNRRYGNGLRRLGLDEVATRFYDEHVEADAVHEQIAAHDLCGGLVRAEPAAGLRRPVRCGGRARRGPPVRRAPAGQLGRRPQLAAVTRPACRATDRLARGGRARRCDIAGRPARRRLTASTAGPLLGYGALRRP